MSMKQRVSRKGARAQRTTAESSWLSRFFALVCIFASLSEPAIARSGIIAILLGALVLVPAAAFAQTTTPPDSSKPQNQPAVSRYLDQTSGMTADEAVGYALAHNGELEAARKEIDSARARRRQARLRANPKLEIEGARQIPPGKDNSVMASAMLPLELGGRRAARITVAEREVEVREREVAN